MTRNSRPPAGRCSRARRCQYALLTYDLVNTHAEPHRRWRSIRRAMPGSPSAPESSGVSTAKDAGVHRTGHTARSGGNGSPKPEIADRLRASCGWRWTQQPLAQLRTPKHQTSSWAFAWPGPKGAARRQQHGVASPTARSGRPAPDAKRVSCFRQGPVQVLRAPAAKQPQESGCLRDRGRGDGSVGSPGRSRPDGACRPCRRERWESRFLNERLCVPASHEQDANGDLWVALWNARQALKVDHKTKQNEHLYAAVSRPAATTRSFVDKKDNYIWVSSIRSNNDRPASSQRPRSGSNSRCPRRNPTRGESSLIRPIRTASISAATSRAASGFRGGPPVATAVNRSRQTAAKGSCGPRLPGLFWAMLAAEIDAVRIGRIKLDSPRVGFRLGQREFDPLPRSGSKRAIMST